MFIQFNSGNVFCELKRNTKLVSVFNNKEMKNLCNNSKFYIVKIILLAL